MEDHVLVSREDWTAARLEVLAEEKALTRHADALAAKRRAMPWTPVVFAKLADGRIAYTYSTYARGIDVFNGAYQILNLTPKGRDEGGRGRPDVLAHGPSPWARSCSLIHG